MRHEDFAIGKEFNTATGKWLCTDKGTRVIVGIKRQFDWEAGPPYALLETVFDEHDIGGCFESKEA